MELNTTSREQGPFHGAIIVKFNLCTTDLKTQHKEICQIAACCNENKFNVYIMPDGHFIAPNATSKHGIQIRGNRYEGYTLLQNRVEVPALSPREGLAKFLDFLSGQTGQTRKVLLAAHRCSSFHRHILVREMKQCHLLDSFQSLVYYIYFKTILYRPDQEKKKIDLETLAVEYLRGNVILKLPRDASVSLEILALLTAAIVGCTEAMMKQHAKDFDVFLRSIDLKEVLKDVISSDMINKIAEAGITIDVLKHEYKANECEGISRLLQEKVDGKFRVTKKKQIIEKINDELSKLLDIDNGNGS